MKPLKKLVGELCYLAPVDASEAERVANWSNDLEVSLRTGDIGYMISYDQQRTYLEGMNSDRGYAFFIVNRATDEVIGIIRLMRVNFINRNAVMGIFIGEQNHRNSGMGTESTKLILDFGFNVLNLRNIMVEIVDFNEASIKMCKKCGFKEIGRRRHSIVFGKHAYDEVLMDVINEEFEFSFIEKYLK